MRCAKVANGQCPGILSRRFQAPRRRKNHRAGAQGLRRDAIGLQFARRCNYQSAVIVSNCSDNAAGRWCRVSISTPRIAPGRRAGPLRCAGRTRSLPPLDFRRVG